MHACVCLMPALHSGGSSEGACCTFFKMFPKFDSGTIHAFWIDAVRYWLSFLTGLVYRMGNKCTLQAPPFPAATDG